MSAGVIAAVVSPSPTGSPFSIAAYQASDGKLLWNTPYRGFTTHFEVSATRLFGVNESRQPVARSLQDGRLLWTGATAGVPIGLTPSAVILASGQSLTALSQQDGSLLWQAPIDPGGLAGSYTLPVANNTLFLVTPNGLVAVRASDGAPVWHFNYPPGQAESVIVADGMVYLAGTTAPDGGDQEICALNISDGSVRWRHTIQSAQLLAEPIAGSQERVSTHALA